MSNLTGTAHLDIQTGMFHPEVISIIFPINDEISNSIVDRVFLELFSQMM